MTAGPLPQLPQLYDRDAAIFTVSVAASLAGMHPQTLRAYDRLGLVVPKRTKGRGRRYSPRDVSKLRLIQHLSQDEGINLNGIKRIIDLQNQLEDVTRQLEQLADLLRRTNTAPYRQGPRVFTADTTGDVNLGRHVRSTRAQQLALPGRPS